MWPNDVILSLLKCQLIWCEKQLWLSWGFRDFRRIFWIVSIMLQQWLYLYIWWCISNVIKFWYTHFHFSIKKISFLSISLSLSLSSIFFSVFLLRWVFSLSLSLCSSIFFSVFLLHWVFFIILCIFFVCQNSSVFNILPNWISETLQPSWTTHHILCPSHSLSYVFIILQPLSSLHHYHNHHIRPKLATPLS